MNAFNAYQELTTKMAMVAGDDKRLLIYIMGLSGETGEVSEKFKKMYRDAGGVMSSEFKEDVKKELGDVLWYVSSIAHELGFTLEEIAEANINKIESRRARNVQHGNGDDR
jgi:NTP pyrophosphatase (non-canonical NTP hydrolase)